jgi:hypothetical protein
LNPCGGANRLLPDRVNNISVRAGWCIVPILSMRKMRIQVGESVAFQDKLQSFNTVSMESRPCAGRRTTGRPHSFPAAWSTAGFRPQNIQRLPSTNRIAAIVTPWYTRSSVCRELFRSPAGAAMEMDAAGEEVCIAGLPFNAFRQGLRILDLAGSHACILRHRIFPEDAGQCEEPNKM